MCALKKAVADTMTERVIDTALTRKEQKP
jgi:hypothetical protein